MPFRRSARPSVHDAPLISGASGGAFEQSASGVLLAGFVVWGGEVVAGLLPLYEGVNERGALSGERYQGVSIGQPRGASRLLLCAGSAVSAIAFEGWTHEGHAALRALQLVWRPVIAGAPAGEPQMSEPVACVQTPSLRRRSHPQGAYLLDTPPGRGIGGLHGTSSIHPNTLGLLTVAALAPHTPRSRWLSPAPAAALEHWL